MTTPEPRLSVTVDAANPGQFFACCGLLELCHRLWGSAAAWFGDSCFFVAAPDGVRGTALDEALRTTQVDSLDDDDEYAPPLWLPASFDLRLDWWTADRACGKELKVWAGSMRGARIARAMQRAMPPLENGCAAVFDYGTVVYDPNQPSKKVEPFYFDARRGSAACALDIGFAPNDFGMTNIAYPAVEFLCLVGLQRFRPVPSDGPRTFEYCTWATPLQPVIAAAAACGLLSVVRQARYRFENGFRTDQRKHKAFLPATRINSPNGDTR